MLNIVSKSKELSKVDLYEMTMSPEILPLNKLPDGTQITPLAWVEFDKEDEVSGEIIRLFSIKDTISGSTYVTQSATFIRDYKAICELMEGEGFSVVKKTGESKSGRGFIYCVLAKK